MPTVEMPFIDEELKLSREGVWLSNGVEITHEQTVRAFARYLKQEGSGWIVEIGNNRKEVVVEDTPYFIVSVDLQKLTVKLNDESIEKLVLESLRYSGERLTCLVKQGQYEAKFLRGPYRELLGKAEVTNGKTILELAGKKIQLG